MVTYFNSVMQDDLFRLGEEFGEKTSEYVWTQAREQTMEAVKQLTVARAARFSELISRKNAPNIPFILLSEEIFYNRSRELDEEIALATNIEDLLDRASSKLRDE